MTFELKFKCDSEAFIENPTHEIVRILRKIADRYDHGDRYHCIGCSGSFAHGLYTSHQNVIDSNDNIVGTYRLTDDPRE